ncbi:Uu.00g089610.m01.CDS01 [Anthostomella pinea]|uniref:Uu.00g089610.m01.CDS01 n=1 Tax=Anthostomella pinea TaxID=933095 RepID=A0AAI8VMR9_9PEZI|nr:Uu.00g089610.m01.CDS01 [Anthostomella pinea]
MSSLSFFTTGTKRKRAPTDGARAPKQKRTAFKTAQRPSKPQSAPKRQVERDDDDSISGSDSDSGDGGEDAGLSGSGSDSEHEGETAAEKRLRMAENYLARVKDEVEETVGFDAEEIDRENIAQRLALDVSENKGKVYKRIAATLPLPRASKTFVRNNTQTTTAVAIGSPFIYSAHKGCQLIKWDYPTPYKQTTKKKPKRTAPAKKRPVKVAHWKGDSRKSKDKDYKGHVGGDILCVAVSHDGIVVTGGSDRRIVVWDESLKPIHFFRDHRDAVTGLAFRRGSNQLYSASKDRSVKVFQVDREQKAYVETLYGHGDHVVDIDALTQERCISVGSRDRTCRLWKVVEETQLLFRGGGGPKKLSKPDVDPKSLAHEGSLDRVAQIDDTFFVTGADNGSISLWTTQRKRPLSVVYQAHGLEPPLQPTDISPETDPKEAYIPPAQPLPITALRTVPLSDLVLSGSWDGFVRVWRFDEAKKTLEPVGILGNPSDSPADLQANGASAEAAETRPDGETDDISQPWLIKGVINDIAVMERGERGKDGLSVVCAVGKELRLGRWKNIKGGKNGLVVFEIPRATNEPLQNGTEDGDVAMKNGA